MTPVNGGRLTLAPGIAVNVLFGVLELKSWALTVTELPINDNAAVTLK